MKKSFLQYMALASILLTAGIALTSHAAPETLEFEYDALGRLTFVKDKINRNRDFDYDPAGNRTNVSVGKTTDDPPPPPPPTTGPRGLHCSQIAPNVYRASWSATAGAAYYIARSNANSNSERRVNSTSVVFDGATCKWVKSCNGARCSKKSYF